MNNPFVLSFGREPINFIPRIDFVQEVEENFYSETRPSPFPPVVRQIKL